MAAALSVRRGGRSVQWQPRPEAASVDGVSVSGSRSTSACWCWLARLKSAGNDEAANPKGAPTRFTAGGFRPRRDW